MKRIIINFSNTELVMLDDDNNDKNTQEYTDELSKLFESHNITILHTSTASVIIRPNNITSIVVYNVEDSDDIQIKEKDYKKIEEVQEESPQDIISD